MRKVKKEKKARDKSASRIRYNILTVLVYLFGAVLLVRLFDLQIVHGSEYREASNTRLTRESILEANRGSIKDSTGNILAAVETEYAIDLYKTLKDDKALNELILNLVKVLEANGDKYIDDSLMIGVEPFRFLMESESEQMAWKKANNIDEDFDAEATFNYFKEKYKIDTEDVQDARKIIAIRYQISYKGYSSTKSIRIANNVSLNTVHIISEQSDKFPGVTIKEDSHRVYPQGHVASHIIGRIGRIDEDELRGNEDRYGMSDIIGKDGIEYVFEKYLKGTKGEKQIYMTVDGAITAEAITKEAVAGANIILTIDSNLQRVTEEALANNINKISSGGFAEWFPADVGAAVVLNVRTGEVLAMASYPDYDPNKFVGGIDYDTWNYYINSDTKPLENKAIATMYSPGSTFKMVTAIAGLETGAISPRSTIRDTGVFRKYDAEWHCWIYTDYRGAHGYLNVVEAIKQSCNYFFYELGDRIGVETLSNYAYYLGLGHKTGVELKGEVQGILSGNRVAEAEGRAWNPGETISSAIGQSYNTFTPLQMAKYIVTLLNRGKLTNVSIIKSIVNADGSEVPKSEYEAYVNERLGLQEENIVENMFQEENVRAILEGMRGVANEAGGTAYNVFKDFNIEVGGKTGSAQTGIKGKTNAWFVGFAPFDDPEIAIAVFVRNGGHGAYTAEVVRDIVAQYFGMNTEEVRESTTPITAKQLIN